MGGSRWNLPELGTGLGLRAKHRAQILALDPGERPVDFFELLTENYLGSSARALEFADRIAARFPVVLHGVSLSIGSTDPLDLDYLRLVAALAERVDARWISDHVCFTGVGGINSHDLLPVPYTEACLEHIVERVKRVQGVLKRPLLLENPSTYIAWAESSMSEEEFLVRLCDAADCALLVDVNNVYVSAFNHGFDPDAYLDALPADRIVQVHIAGHERYETHLIDTHGGPVPRSVWEIYRRLCQRIGPVSTLLEWDQDIPDFDVAAREARRSELHSPRKLRHELAVG
jgi:uncharacterized protein